ncbi:MAG: TIGR04282 family arsenosugar biosynthesis glycosyltransferase [Sandaracinaceae bacterium]|nr:TIGR04282 family arsenosugar biosynthesis glycosyltransferase [Sandaracinaceae bacterium]
MRAGEAPLLVFGRAPRPGTTKTRLIGALGAAGAAQLSAAFLADVLATSARVAPAVELWCPPEDVEEMEGARPQRGDDLGARMTHALADALSRAPAALLIGSDVPTLPASHLAAALDALARHDVVLGPSADGGFYLIGARGEVPDLGGPIRWSSRHALDDVRARLRGLRVGLARPWYDVDTEEDLRLLRAHLALDPRAAPRSAATLADFDRMRRAT